MAKGIKKELPIGLIMIALSFLLIIFAIILLIIKPPKKEEEKENKQNDNDNNVNVIIKEPETLNEFPDGEIKLDNEELLSYFELYKIESDFENNNMRKLNTDATITEKELNSAKMYIALRKIKDEELEKINCSELTTDKYIVNEDHEIIYTCTDETVMIKKEIIDKYYELYFGDAENIEYEAFNKNEAEIYVFDEKQNSYVKYNTNIKVEENNTQHIQSLSKAKKAKKYIILTINSKVNETDTENESVISLQLKWDEKYNRYLFDLRKESTKIEEAKVSFDFSKMENELNNLANNTNPKRVACFDNGITEDGLPNIEETDTELSQESIRTIINKLKDAKLFEETTISFIGCPPNEISYIIGEGIYNNDFNIFYGEEGNVLLIGYDNQEYAFKYDSPDEISNFIESLE